MLLSQNQKLKSKTRIKKINVLTYQLKFSAEAYTLLRVQTKYSWPYGRP